MKPCDSQQININMKYNSNATVLAIPDRKMYFSFMSVKSDWFTHVFHGQKTVDIWCKYVTHERITNSSPIATGSSQASRQVVPPPLEVFWRKVLRAISSCEAPPRCVQSCEALQGMYNLTKSTAWEFWPKVLHEILSWEIPQTAIYCKLEVIRLKPLEGASFFDCSDQTNQLVIIICLNIWSWW